MRQVSAVLILLAALSAVHGHLGNNYQNSNAALNSAAQGHITPARHLGQPVNIYGQFDSSTNAISSRFDSGFIAEQFSPGKTHKGVYPIRSNNNFHNYQLNSYDYALKQERFPRNAHRQKRFSSPDVIVIDKHNPIGKVLAGNRRFSTAPHALEYQGLTSTGGAQSTVDRQTSNIGKGLTENERLRKVLHDLENGGNTLIAHGEILGLQSSRIGKGLSENVRLNKLLNDIRVKGNKIVVRGSQRKAMNKIRAANASLRIRIEQDKQRRQIEIEQTIKQIRQENAKLTQQIVQARQQKANNPLGVALHENKRLKAELSHGEVSFVDKYTSNIGKGQAENERLKKVLHDIQHGGDTLLLHGAVIDMSTHHIGLGLTENERLNKILNDVQSVKDSIVVKGSPANKMLEIRKANALLRQQIKQAKHQRKTEQENTMKQIRQENAKLRKQIAQQG